MYDACTANGADGQGGVCVCLGGGASREGGREKEMREHGREGGRERARKGVREESGMEGERVKLDKSQASLQSVMRHAAGREAPCLSFESHDAWRLSLLIWYQHRRHSRHRIQHVSRAVYVSVLVSMPARHGSKQK